MLRVGHVLQQLWHPIRPTGAADIASVMLTPLVLHSRFGDKTFNFYVVRPPNGTAVLQRV